MDIDDEFVEFCVICGEPIEDDERYEDLYEDRLNSYCSECANRIWVSYKGYMDGY